MVKFQRNDFNRKKKDRPIDREMNTALYLLRCYELNIFDAELDAMTIGMVYDIFTEKGNDSCEYHQLATQDDFNRF